MKKHFTRILSALCASAMLMSGAAVLPASAAEESAAPRIMGDMNGDCRVTIEDAKRTLDVFVGSQIGLCEANVTEETNPGDIDMNGTIEIADALAIMRYFCQTLAGDQPMWAEVRNLTYHDGTDFDPEFVSEEAEKDYKRLPFEKRGMYLEIGCAEGKAGETVEIPVYIAGIAHFNGFQYFQNTPENVDLLDIDSTFGMIGKCVLNPETGKYEYHKAVKYSNEEFSAVANTENGAIVWATANGVDLNIKDGMVIATYTYKIPDDAKSGDLFVISADAGKTMFVTSEEEDNYAILSYQYTLLDGVIAVK